jgi:hypothetical protein
MKHQAVIDQINQTRDTGTQSKVTPQANTAVEVHTLEARMKAEQVAKQQAQPTATVRPGLGSKSSAADNSIASTPTGKEVDTKVEQFKKHLEVPKNRARNALGLFGPKNTPKGS